VRNLTTSDRLACLNVGRTISYVTSNMPRRVLEFRHKPTRKNASHSGIYNLEPNGDTVAEYLVESIVEIFPAK